MGLRLRVLLVGVAIVVHTHTHIHTIYRVMKLKMQCMRNCLLLKYYYYYYYYRCCYMRNLHAAKRIKTKTFHLVETEKCCA